MQAEVFLDTGYAIALAAVTDQYHAQAVALAQELEAAGTRMVTTQPVLLEIGNALAKRRYRPAAVQLLSSLEADPNVEIVLLSVDLYVRAYRLYDQRVDKEWGLTDCVSFLVMQDRGLTEALSADEHFRQAGFQTLLSHASA